MKTPAYVLVTPVRDEVATVARTIQAVTGQTHLPQEWVIVSDGSSDGTDEVVESAAMERPWIRLLKLPARPGRSFAAVVKNTEAGIAALKSVDYDYLGLLDADIEFQSDYYEKLLRHFQDSPRLGLGGGVVVDVGSRAAAPRNLADVPGAVQFFRRECFTSLGPLYQIPEGGWDCLTCVVARMNGFDTRLFPELVVNHLKPRNAAEGGLFRRHWQLGQRDYALGYAPEFAVARWFARALVPSPGPLGALAALLGYAGAGLRGLPRVIPSDVVAFLRKEQRARLLGRRMNRPIGVRSDRQLSSPPTDIRR